MVRDGQKMELVDRLFAMSQAFDAVVGEHPAADLPELKVQVDKAREALYAAYLEVGMLVTTYVPATPLPPSFKNKQS